MYIQIAHSRRYIYSHSPIRTRSRVWESPAVDIQPDVFRSALSLRMSFAPLLSRSLSLPPRPRRQNPSSLLIFPPSHIFYALSWPLALLPPFLSQSFCCGQTVCASPSSPFTSPLPTTPGHLLRDRLPGVRSGGPALRRPGARGRPPLLPVPLLWQLRRWDAPAPEEERRLPTGPAGDAALLHLAGHHVSVTPACTHARRLAWESMHVR